MKQHSQNETFLDVIVRMGSMWRNWVVIPQKPFGVCVCVYGGRERPNVQSFWQGNFCSRGFPSFHIRYTSSVNDRLYLKLAELGSDLHAPPSLAEVIRAARMYLVYFLFIKAFQRGRSWCLRRCKIVSAVKWYQPRLHRFRFGTNEIFWTIERMINYADQRTGKVLFSHCIPNDEFTYSF